MDELVELDPYRLRSIRCTVYEKTSSKTSTQRSTSTVMTARLIASLRHDFPFVTFDTASGGGNCFAAVIPENSGGRLIPNGPMAASQLRAVLMELTKEVHGEFYST